MRKKKRDYTGTESGKLVLIRYSRPGGGGVGSIWWASCSCGTTTEVVAKRVLAGRVRTCGNCTKGLGIQAGNIVADSRIPKCHKRHFISIIKAILDAGLVPDVTPDMYLRLKGNVCVGCGTHETHVELGTKPRSGDSTQLIPICDRCSSWRMGRNVLEWLAMCVQVAGAVRGRLG